MASDSVRKIILDAIKAVLEGITRSTKYRSTVDPDNVYFSEQLPEEFPSLVVSVGAETPEESSLEYLTWRLNFGVECWVDREDGRGDLTHSLEDLIADVRTALQDETNPLLWPKILELEDLGTAEVFMSDADPNRAQCLIRFALVYRHIRNNPSQP